MPTLSTPTLTLGAIDNNKRDVTVAGTFTFDASDVGKTYRLTIKLFGEDKSGDKLPSGDAVGDDQVYVYNFPGPFLQRPYKVISVAAAGTVSYSEKRAVSVSSLDEDPGVVTSNQGGVLIQTPRRDEVFARVALSILPVTQQSATVISGFGV